MAVNDLIYLHSTVQGEYPILPPNTWVIYSICLIVKVLPIVAKACSKLSLILSRSYKNNTCTTIHRYPIFSTRYSVTCNVYNGYHGTSEIEHGLCACTVDNPLAKARRLSLRTGAQTMLYLSLMDVAIVRCEDKGDNL